MDLVSFRFQVVPRLLLFSTIQCGNQLIPCSQLFLLPPPAKLWHVPLPPPPPLSPEVICVRVFVGGRGHVTCHGCWTGTLLLTRVRESELGDIFAANIRNKFGLNSRAVPVALYVDGVVLLLLVVLVVSVGQSVLLIPNYTGGILILCPIPVQEEFSHRRHNRRVVGWVVPCVLLVPVDGGGGHANNCGRVEWPETIERQFTLTVLMVVIKIRRGWSFKGEKERLCVCVCV